MSGITMQDILTQVGAAKNVIDTGTQKIEDFLAEAGTLSKGSADLMKQAASDAALVSQTETAAALSTQTAKQKLGIDFGTDKNAQNEVYTMLSGLEKQSFEEMRSAKAVIDEKESKTLLDDPIGYITSKLTINGDIRKYNAAEQNRELALKRIEDLNRATLSSATLQSQFANTVTIASAEAAARLAATAAKVKANEFTVEGIKYNIAGVKAALDASAQKLGFLFQEKQAQNADATLALAQRAASRADEEWEARKAAKLKDDKYDSSVIEAINLGRTIRGVPVLTGVKADSALSAIKGKSPASEEFYADWKAGEFAQATGKFQLGQTIPEVAARLKSGTPILVSPPQEAVRSRFDDAIKYVTEAKGYDPKDVAGNIKKLNLVMLDMLGRDATEVRPGDGKNIFAIAPLEQIVKSSPAAAEAPVYVKVLKPLMDSGVDMNDPSRVMAAVVDAIQKGKLSYNDAISLTTIYQVGSAANLAQRNFQKFGIPDVGKFYAYNARINSFTAEGGRAVGDEVVDLTKPDLVGRYLNKYLSTRAQFNLMNPGVEPSGANPFNYSGVERVSNLVKGQP